MRKSDHDYWTRLIFYAQARYRELKTYKMIHEKFGGNSPALFLVTGMGCNCLSTKFRYTELKSGDSTNVQVEWLRFKTSLSLAQTSEENTVACWSVTGCRTATRHTKSFSQETQYSHTKAFHKKPDRVLLRSTKHVLTYMLPRFLENLLESENLACSATAGTKTALETSSFGSIILATFIQGNLQHRNFVGFNFVR